MGIKPFHFRSSLYCSMVQDDWILDSKSLWKMVGVDVMPCLTEYFWATHAERSFESLQRSTKASLVESGPETTARSASSFITCRRLISSVAPLKNVSCFLSVNTCFRKRIIAS